MCIHKRARKVILFGFDYDGNGNGHSTDAANWTKWAEHFSVFVAPLRVQGVDVVNACPQSTIRFFQKVQLDDGVRMLHA